MPLPLHHIDSCILLPESHEELKQSRKYMKFSGEKYLVKVSIPALGECLMKALTVDYQTYLDIIESIRNIKDNSELKIYPVEQSHTKIDEIMKIDNRIEPTDCSIFACAIEDKAKNFITTDEELLENDKLEEKFKIKIRHPEDAPRFS